MTSNAHQRIITAVSVALLGLLVAPAPASGQFCSHTTTDTVPDVGCDSVVWSDGFEDCSKAVEWTFEDHGWGSEWWYFTDNHHSGDNALYFGDPWRSTLRYSNDSDAHALSPLMSLPNAQVTLEFWIWAKLESGYDYFFVDVLHNGSATNVYTETGHQTSWRKITVDLSAWGGQDVRIRLRGYTDYSVKKTGVWIDDFVVSAEGSCCTNDSQCDDGLACSVDSCSGGNCTFDMSACNGGSCQQTKPNFIILLDRSGSMDNSGGSGGSKWNVTINALDAALATYASQLNAGLKLFPTPGYGSCGVSNGMDVPMGATANQIISALYNTYASGATPMGSALQKSGNIYSNANNYDPDAPRYVMVITDGKETCGWNPEAEVAALAQSGIETFVVGFGDGVDAGVLNNMAVEGGHAMPSSTQYYTANDSAQLEAAFDSILNVATQEVCDGIDNDCDGETDEDVGTLSCFHPTCGEGVRQCINGAWGDCELPISNEICDGADNNCNMVADDPWVDGIGPVLGQVCVAGTGLCERAGVYVCPANQVDEAVCSASPGPAQVEGCNLIDDDCDGYTDNDVTGDPADLKTSCYVGTGTPGVGICQMGERTCDGGNWTGCSGYVSAQAEVCNGLDDDCDGQTDELPQCCATDADCTGSCDACVDFECEAVLGEINQPHIVTLIDFSSAMQATTGAGMSRWQAAVEGMELAVSAHGAATQHAVKLYHTPGQASCTVDGDLDVDLGLEFMVGGYLSAKWPVGSGQPLESALSQTRSLIESLSSVPDGTTAVVLLTSGEVSCSADAQAVTDKLVELNAAGIHVAIVGLDGARVSELSDWGFAGGFGLIPSQSYWPAADGSEVAAAFDAVVDAMGSDMCNGVDDNCDGDVDEDVTPRSCFAVCTGTLVPGTRTCGNGDYGTCNPISVSEACDGLDNDCDGSIDEPFTSGANALGVSCSAGQGACERSGVFACSDDGARTECDAVPGTGSSETCDGVDNDCDGVTDDAWIDGTFPSRLGQPCGVGLGECQSAGLFVCPASGVGAPVCSAQTPVAAAETCDGLDNDCDGLTDEDPTDPSQPLTLACYGAANETLNVGACRAGLRTCTSGGFSACVDAVLPSAEICDGIDNDCDGLTDEDAANPTQTMSQTCYDGPSGTAGAGECQAGVQQCLGSLGWGSCAGQVLPSTEVCDGLDSDCNGVTDDSWADGSYGNALGEPCTAGLGACAVTGTYACSANGQGAPVCSADAGAAAVEVCDGVDNDCDGLTDENEVNQILTRTCLPSPGGPHGLGWCQAGAQYCDLGSWSSCVGAEPAEPEVCDGEDNDCDGGTDESDADPSQPLQTECFEGPGAAQNQGVCRGGYKSCQAGSYGACSGQVLPSAELCDGLDNDCDGGTDEGDVDAQPLRESCYGGAEEHAGVGACTVGERSCSGGGWGECVGDVMPTAETCNGIDDDCDGLDDAEELNSPGDDEDGPCENDMMCQFGNCYCVNVPSQGSWACILE